jgi:hypothetical protein
MTNGPSEVKWPDPSHPGTYNRPPTQDLEQKAADDPPSQRTDSPGQEADDQAADDPPPEGMFGTR